MSMARGSRMLRYINYRMKVTLQDSRVLVGTFLAFDRHMNIVLGDTEEYRVIKTKGVSKEETNEKRSIGLIVLRGDAVISLTVQGPPPPEFDEKATTGGPGVVKATGRGMPVAPAPVAMMGPARGLVGGPGMAMMQPQFVGAPTGLPMPHAGMGFPPRGLPGMPPPQMGAGFPPRGMPGLPGFPGLPPPPRGPPGMGVPPGNFPRPPM